MKKIITAALSILSICGLSTAQTQSYQIHTASDAVRTLFDGGKEQVRKVIASQQTEEIVTTASVVTFISDIDTLHVSPEPWATASVEIIRTGADTCRVKVYRRPANPFENPSPVLRNISPTGKLSREQAVFDTDALIYGISNVHPDMFSVCSQTDFFQAIDRFKSSLPDSIDVGQLYLGLTPIVAMLGDGHTHLLLPDSKVLADHTPIMPLHVNVTPERTILCRWSKGNAVPVDAEILTINGITADSIISDMLAYESGERDHFKLMRVDYDFTGLLHLLYPAAKYSVTYHKAGTQKVKKVTLAATPWSEVKEHFATNDEHDLQEPYSFTIHPERNIAILDFRACYSPDGMKQFADSMFSLLRAQGIGNLIIDVRENGGGNSQVGDLLLQYICPRPFTQMDKMLMKVTPLTVQLLNARNLTPQFSLFEVPESDYVTPLTPSEGFYTGNVYLLTSAKTFSAAASFAWVFAQCKIGPVIGEETGGMNVSYGDKVWYTLPVSGLECGISFKRFWQFGADDSSIHGALPTIAVPAPAALSTALTLISPQ